MTFQQRQWHRNPLWSQQLSTNPDPFGNGRVVKVQNGGWLLHRIPIPWSVNRNLLRLTTDRMVFCWFTSFVSRETAGFPTLLRVHVLYVHTELVLEVGAFPDANSTPVSAKGCGACSCWAAIMPKCRVCSGIEYHCRVARYSGTQGCFDPNVASLFAYLKYLWKMKFYCSMSPYCIQRLICFPTAAVVNTIRLLLPLMLLDFTIVFICIYIDCLVQFSAGKLIIQLMPTILQTNVLKNRVAPSPDS